MLYGVEAARKLIIDQLRMVFDVYAIKVDHRHLSLIADYMVRSIISCGMFGPRVYASYVFLVWKCVLFKLIVFSSLVWKAPNSIVYMCYIAIALSILE